VFKNCNSNSCGGMEFGDGREIRSYKSYKNQVTKGRIILRQGIDIVKKPCIVIEMHGFFVRSVFAWNSGGYCNQPLIRNKKIFRMW